MDRVKPPAPSRPGENPPDILTTEQTTLPVGSTKGDPDVRGTPGTLRFYEHFGSTRCHLAEITGLDLDTIHLSKQAITVRGKGNRVRTVGIHPRTVRDLDRYLRTRATHPACVRDQCARCYRNRCPGTARYGGLTTAGIYQIINRRAAASESSAIQPSPTGQADSRQ
jgi:site-specific recombinase XerD